MGAPITALTPLEPGTAAWRALCGPPLNRRVLGSLRLSTPIVVSRYGARSEDEMLALARVWAFHVQPPKCVHCGKRKPSRVMFGSHHRTRQEEWDWCAPCRASASKIREYASRRAHFDAALAAQRAKHSQPALCARCSQCPPGGIRGGYTRQAEWNLCLGCRSVEARRRKTGGVP